MSRFARLRKASRKASESPRKPMHVYWSRDETRILTDYVEFVRSHGLKVDWELVSTVFPQRTARGCESRYYSVRSSLVERRREPEVSEAPISLAPDRAFEAPDAPEAELASAYVSCSCHAGLESVDRALCDIAELLLWDA